MDAVPCEHEPCEHESCEYHEPCEHEPDWLTAETWRAADGGVYLYVDCTLCGWVGCVGIADMLALGIEWDNPKGDSSD